MKQRIMELLAVEKGEDMTTMPTHRKLYWEHQADMVIRVMWKVLGELVEVEEMPRRYINPAYHLEQYRGKQEQLPLPDGGLEKRRMAFIQRIGAKV